ncbi:hypothetical protein QF026_008454 [Streptomyces aurantiacus]|nr:hypothetical protein [Streptomyces aurantiacus]
MYCLWALPCVNDMENPVMEVIRVCNSGDSEEEMLRH